MADLQRLAGHHALLTGAGGGIGLAVTAAFLAEGARCTAVDLARELGGGDVAEVDDRLRPRRDRIHETIGVAHRRDQRSLTDRAARLDHPEGGQEKGVVSHSPA